MKSNGSKTFIAIIAVMVAGLGLGWKIIDARIGGEVRAINAHVEWVDAALDDRAEIFEARVYEISRRLAKIENGQDHIRQQLDKIEKKVDEL